MHSGFTALRSHCPMNIEALLPDTGALIWRDQPGVRADVQRLVEMWGALLQRARRAHAVRPVHRGRRLLCPRVHAPAHVRPARSARTSPPMYSACASCPA